MFRYLLMSMVLVRSKDETKIFWLLNNDFFFGLLFVKSLQGQINFIVVPYKHLQ